MGIFVVALMLLLCVWLVISGLQTLFKGRGPSSHHTHHRHHEEMHIHNSFNRSEYHAANRTEEKDTDRATVDHDTRTKRW